MPEPFKNAIYETLIAAMAGHFKQASEDFDAAGFTAAATAGLDDLELKQRVDRIKDAMDDFLPSDFERSAAIILASLHPDEDAGLSDTDVDGAGTDHKGIRGWAIWPIALYVGDHGIADFERGMALQKDLTKRFSAEFGIRSFLLADPERALKIMTDWLDDPNHHVRRLVSEGTRPRLPWGLRLPVFVRDPAPLLPLLEALKDDPSEYVRRSVANNLNDIAKDHPDLVAEIAGRWLTDAGPEREKLVRQACRTLIKQGHEATLSALGYGPPKVRLTELSLETPVVRFGEALRFAISLVSEAETAQPLILDYVVHHRKANGTTSPKVFKWKTLTLDGGGTHDATRKHGIRPITTRVYHAGTHHLEIQVNGRSLGRADFELMMG